MSDHALIKNGFLTIIMVSLIASIFASSGVVGLVQSDESGAVQATSRTVIRVNSDAELASLIGSNHWSGDGTVSYPYVIENIEINATGYAAAIYIGNTSLHLTISNCSLYGATRAGSGIISSITLNNTANCTVSNNTCSENAKGVGIYLRSAGNNTINGNICQGDYDGILLYSSNNNILSNNNCSNDGQGILLNNSINNIL